VQVFKSSRNGIHRQQQFFLTTERRICKEREMERSHVVAIRAGPTEIVIALIGRATSPIIASSINIVGAIRPSHQRQGNWDHVKVIVFIKCKKQEHVNFRRFG
jgi:tRNA A37 threonylcarbamoyladenosine synthetase subunit TsaC/SUA5/YrdC